MASIRFGLVCECKAKKWVVKLARNDHKSLEIGDRHGLRHPHFPSGACRAENANAILKGKITERTALLGYEPIRNEIGRYI
jgi:hypothetical protein